MPGGLGLSELSPFTRRAALTELMNPGLNTPEGSSGVRTCVRVSVRVRVCRVCPRRFGLGFGRFLLRLFAFAYSILFPDGPTQPRSGVRAGRRLPAPRAPVTTHLRMHIRVARTTMGACEGIRRYPGWLRAAHRASSAPNGDVAARMHERTRARRTSLHAPRASREWTSCCRAYGDGARAARQ